MRAFCELEDVVTADTSVDDEVEKREWKKREAKANAIIDLTLSIYHLDHARKLASSVDVERYRRRPPTSPAA